MVEAAQITVRRSKSTVYCKIRPFAENR